MSKIKYLVVLFQLAIAEIDDFRSNYGMNEMELTTKYRYPLEVHHVTTEDGYILELYRIPYGRHDKTNIGKRPIALLFPGMIGDSSGFLCFGNRRSPGFILADNGFDVWLGNIRGSRKARKHTFLDPDINKKQFWNFSIEEFALYDVPNTIDYILNITKQRKLFFQGYSQSSTIYFMMTSEKPEYNNKIHLSSLFTPHIYSKHINNPLYEILLSRRKDFKKVLNLLHIYEIFTYDATITLTFYILCVYFSFMEAACKYISSELMGTSSYIDLSLVPLLLTFIPTGTSSKVLLHYLQIDSDKSFAKYNYGKKENMIRYNQQSPPEFNLSAATAPVAIYYGGADIIINPTDVESLITKLPNLVEAKRMKNYGHLDFAGIADTASTELFPEVIKNMKKYL